MHTPGAQVSKSMHPAAKMCTQVNFEHWIIIAQQYIKTITSGCEIYVIGKKQPYPKGMSGSTNRFITTIPKGYSGRDFYVIVYNNHSQGYVRL